MSVQDYPECVHRRSECMKNALIVVLIWAAWTAAFSQPNHPFAGGRADQDISAYWYNVPRDSFLIKVMGQTLPFQSTLEVYAVAPADSFAVSLAAHADDGTIFYSKVIVVKGPHADPSIRVQRKGKHFKLTIPVKHQPTPPSRIDASIVAGEVRRSKSIECRYHRLSGKITDFAGRPFRAVVVVRPDDFEGSAGVWSDANGMYSVLLPERIYSNIFVDDESYGTETAEAWGWHIIMDADQTIDFKVGTGEVYNLNVWPNNGGARTTFLSFRPMSVFFYGNIPAAPPVTIDGTTYPVVDVGAELRPENLTVAFNGKQTPVVSLQRYFEWTSGKMMPAYLVQVSREGLETVGKQTVTVEYRSESMVGGKKLVHTSMGVFQFYSNFSGLSFF